jgi:hypothetical protein
MNRAVSELALVILWNGFDMTQQKSAYFLLSLSFVLGMIATTSISGCNDAASSNAKAPAAPVDPAGNSQIQLDKPLPGGTAPAPAASK